MSARATSPQVIKGLQNIRLISAFVVSGGWIAAMVVGLIRISDRASESFESSVCCGDDESTQLIAVGLAVAAVYLVAAIAYRLKRLSSATSSFVLTMLFAPMVMMSFALAFDHTFDSAAADAAVVGGGVLNLAVIVTSWLITAKSTTSET